MSNFTWLAAIALFLFPAQEMRAWSSRASKTVSQVQSLESWVESYRSEHNRLPTEQEFRVAMSDGQEILPHLRTDRWKNEFIYRVPGKQGEYDLYSPGEDGTDDGGLHDDISASAEVREGYYWKKRWPLGRWILRASGGALILVLLLRRFRPGTLAAPIAGLCAGGGMAYASKVLQHPGHVPSHNTPLELLWIAGVLIALFSAIRIRGILEGRRKTR